MENEMIKLNGTIDLNGVKINNIEGGFGQGNKAILFSDVALKHGVEPKSINQLINRNINRYTKDDLLDLCNENFKVTASDLGLITSNSQKFCYILSERGYIKLVSSMSNDNEKKWEVMNEVIDNYFNMRQVINSDEELKKNLLMSIYKGGAESVVATRQLVELETKPLLNKIEEQTPFVKIAIERLDKGEKISLTDVTKSLDLKKGQISVFLKLNGYLHKTQTEVNEKGKDMFKIYKENGFSCIGILEEGIKFIQDNIDEIRKSPCRMPKNK